MSAPAGAADEAFTATKAISAPSGTINSFDISFVDPVLGIYLLGDRTQAGTDQRLSMVAGNCNLAKRAVEHLATRDLFDEIAIFGSAAKQPDAALERHPAFPRRVNVHFVQVDAPDEVNMRTWERGSGITLACGTGA